jgi:hypothetical protein
LGTAFGPFALFAASTTTPSISLPFLVRGFFDFAVSLFSDAPVAALAPAMARGLAVLFALEEAAGAGRRTGSAGERTTASGLSVGAFFAAGSPSRVRACSATSGGTSSGQTMPRPSSPTIAYTEDHGTMQKNGERLKLNVQLMPSSSTRRSGIGTGMLRPTCSTSCGCRLNHAGTTTPAARGSR